MNLRLLYLRIFRFEFWPWKVLYAPLLPYYLFLCLKTRRLLFPAQVNTCLQHGGFFDENKKEILKRIPGEYLPITFHVETISDFKLLNGKIKNLQLNFPLVAKPVDGQRGKSVEVIHNEAELDDYYHRIKKEFVVQEFIEHPIELAIFYSRFPDRKKGTVSSVASKEFLSVTGDGIHTTEQLLKTNPRARLIWENLLKNTKTNLQEIVQNGKTVIVEPIGNHCRGTIFRNSSDIDKEKIAAIIDQIMAEYTGFHYGRFDLKVKSIEDFYEAKTIKILELNGVNADPAHIFDPEYHLFTAYKDIIWHWNRLSEIALVNLKKGQTVKVRFPLLK